MSGNELPKIIDKSQADIDAAISAIKSSDLPSGTKDFAISCIKLAIWLPKAILEQKIRLSNLRKLIFGRGKNNCSRSNTGGAKPPAENPEPEPSLSDVEALREPPFEEPATTNCAKAPGHGRLPHTTYTNTVEHTLAISDLKPGDLCPEHCGGRLYHYEPGVLVRIKGQNLAAVHKYWV